MSKIATFEHIREVQSKLHNIIIQLLKRSKNHDKTKLEIPELEIFEKYTPKLANTTYGSDEYKQFLVEMKPALDHHYAHNSHHPEYFPNGIQGMSLLDLIEMLCDWASAVQRHKDGNIEKSIEINQKRFGYSDELKQIFFNTLKDI